MGTGRSGMLLAKRRYLNCCRYLDTFDGQTQTMTSSQATNERATSTASEQRARFRRDVVVAMPSRKRNKGQARRAKAAASTTAAPANSASLRPKIAHIFETNNACCRHGSPVTFPPGHAVCGRFFHAFFDGFTALSQSQGIISRCGNSLEAAYKRYPDALDANNKKNLQLIVDCFSGLGAQYIIDSELEEDYETFHFMTACLCACVVLILEAYQPSTGIRGILHAGAYAFRVGPDALKNLDISYRCKRSIIKFFHKRIPCSCLEEKYKTRKCEPKQAVCSHCDTKRDRREMFICTKCESSQYCSRECQLGHWPDHKGICREVSENRKRQG